MRCFEEFQAAIFDEGNAAPGELDLQGVGVMQSAKKHGLFTQGNAGFEVVQHAINDVIGLLIFIDKVNEGGLLAGPADGDELFFIADGGEGDGGVGGIEHALGGAVILLELNDLGAGELFGEIEDILHGGSAEGVNALGVIADNGQAAPAGAELLQNPGLENVGVLIFIDKYGIEAGGDLLGDFGGLYEVIPVKQQIVVIEDVLLMLGLGVGLKEGLEGVGVLGAPGEMHLQGLFDGFLGVYAA